MTGGHETLVPVGELRTVVLADPDRDGPDSIISASVNDTGQVVVAESERIVRYPSGEAVVRAGDSAPGGGRFTRFGEVDAGEDGYLLFGADVGTTSGVFLRTPAGFHRVAQAGERSPGGHWYASFGQLTLTGRVIDGELWHQLAMVARSADGRTSLVLASSYADPVELLVSGERVAGGTVEDIAISRLGFAVCVVATMSRAGRRFRQALLADTGRVTWGERVREGAGFPELGRIERVEDPPGLNLYQGLVAVELDDGSSALVTRPVGVDPVVLARTGDPAPGLPDATLGRIGSPVANSGVPDGGACGIAAMTRLSTGGTALWVGVLSRRLPPAGRAMIPLVVGETTDDPTDTTVLDCRPVKFSNNGTLLLRAVLDVDGRPRHGLLRLDGLLPREPRHS